MSKTHCSAETPLGQIRNNLVARCGITFMAMEPEKHPFENGRFSDLGTLFAQ